MMTCLSGQLSSYTDLLSLLVTSSYSIRARWIIPVDAPPIEGGVVTIVDGLIAAIGIDAEESIEDLGEVVLLPGLVNSHTHLEFSNLQQPLGRPGMSLPNWIRLVIASRQQSHRDSQQAIATGLCESCQAGVTTIGDIATESPRKTTPKPSPHVVGFQEVIGFSEARSDSALAELVQRLATSADCSADQGISPHAPYTVHPNLLKRLVELARNQKIVVAMHLAESLEELELLANGTGPFQQLLEERSMWDSLAIVANSRPMDYLQVLAQAPRAMVVHGNYLAADEIDYLAERRDRMSVTFCPRTHEYFGHSAYPLPQMLTAGVCVSLGTDSKASNPDLSLLGEMRHVAKQYPDIKPEIILRMGTLSGAEALGLAEVTGSITPGKWADFMTVPYDEQAQDPLECVLMSNEMPRHTYLRGQRMRAYRSDI